MCNGIGSTIILLIAVLAGCTETIILRNEETGDEVTCPGEIKLPGRPPTHGCRNGYESLGYRSQ